MHWEYAYAEFGKKWMRFISRHYSNNSLEKLSGNHFNQESW
jgi:hypothetical protein